MARIQQSIDLEVPVHIAYNQLTQFEDYPQFMDDVAEVRQLDDTHLHWSGTMADRNIEWEAEITEQRPGQCIAWRTVGGPHNSGRLELQPIGLQQARVTLTMECEPGAFAGTAQGDPEEALMQRLGEDLVRFKSFVEAHGADTDGWPGEVRSGQVLRPAQDMAGRGTGGDAIGKAIGQTAGELREGRRTDAPATRAPSTGGPMSSGYAAGSEGGDYSEEFAAPQPQDRGRQQAGQQQDASRYQEQASLPFGQQQEHTTQSDSSLSHDGDNDDERFSVAGEQNFDQQSDQARRVGQAPQEQADAMAASLKKGAAGDASGTGDKPA